MSKVCVVCGNKASETDREKVDPLQKVTYHEIPKSGNRNREWLAFCSLSKDDNLSNKFVCSDHFEKQYLKRDLKSEELDGVKRMILTKQAVPTIRKPKILKRKRSQDSNDEYGKNREEAFDKFLTALRKKPTTRSSTRVQSKKQATSVTTMLGNGVPVKSSFRPKSRDKQIRALELKINELEQLIEKKNEKLNLAKTEMVNITIALQELKAGENLNLHVRVRELLQGHYTENQIRKLLCRTYAVTWSNEEMQKAFESILYGRDVYDYICSRLHYPLPSPKEMLQWVQRIYQQTGFLTSTLSVLHTLGSKMDPRERECVLLLGRTHVRPEYQYDMARDQIFGKSAYLYCICVQSVLADWRQIIHIDFDLIYTAELLLALINELYDVGFNVVGVSGTCDQDIIDLWTDFDVSIEKHFISHPKTKQPIYMLTCAISTLSLIRKIFVEEGFLVQDDVHVTKDVVQKLYESNHPEISQLLSTTTLDTLLKESNTSDMETLNDMISSNVVKALNILSEEEEEAVSVLATLFELFRDWYDLSTTEGEPKNDVDNAAITHQQYGTNIEEQDIVLDGMYDTMESLKCSSEQSSCLQKAVMVSMNSLKKLRTDLSKRHGLKSIPTKNLTLYNLNRIFHAFQNINKSSIQPTSKILFDLSEAVANSDPTSMSNRIIQVTHLAPEKLEYYPPKVVEDPSIANISETQACWHLTKYIASALRGKYKYLGEETFVIERRDNSYVVTEDMPVGTVEPSRLWAEQARKLESYLSDITFYRNDNVIENLVASISKCHPKMGADIIRLYVEKRIMIRVKNLNNELEYV